MLKILLTKKSGVAVALICLKIPLTKEFEMAVGSAWLNILLSNEFRVEALARSEVLLKKGFEIVVASTRSKMSSTEFEMGAALTCSKILPTKEFGARVQHVRIYFCRTSSGLPQLLCAQKYHSKSVQDGRTTGR